MFRFTIRDVLWLTVLVAVLVAWFLDHRAVVVERNTTADLLEEARQRALVERELAEMAQLHAELIELRYGN